MQTLEAQNAGRGDHNNSDTFIAEFGSERGDFGRFHGLLKFYPHFPAL